jgi:hypothetical protein
VALALENLAGDKWQGEAAPRPSAAWAVAADCSLEPVCRLIHIKGRALQAASRAEEVEPP